MRFDHGDPTFCPPLDERLSACIMIRGKISVPQCDTFLANFGLVSGVEEVEISFEGALVNDCRVFPALSHTLELCLICISPLLYLTSSYAAPKRMLF